MKIVADENIDGFLVALLREQGHTVTWIGEAAPSVDDWEVLRIAHELDALLITEDKGISRDIFELHLPCSGILLLRVHNMSFADRAALVGQVILENEANLEDKFGVLTNKRLRLRPIR